MFKELLQLEIDNETLERGSIRNQEKIKMKHGNKNLLSQTHTPGSTSKVSPISFSSQLSLS